VVVSPQDLVSCDHTNHGCGGGWLKNAFNYIAQFGVPPDSEYGYTSG